ncbi:Zinc finger protein ZAT11 [Morus notabilis]|uniref:Zinc finger protein ZAT11 n=1 Tax=Morus notabilis TaxID=981085 RepID=W9R4H9_9ROSA|nr:zinc finger protein ZAT11 [Morus notabilis]EXB67892.1 Zinc finger protein ZAT11 [Morus notabilis]
MKRMREEEEKNYELDTAKYLMLLGSGLAVQPIRQYRPPSTDVFECKTCNRRFSSFQALGGHRASHNKRRMTVDDHHESAKTSPAKSSLPKKHECSICGVVFSMGQALGGHMRRHKAIMEMQGSFADIMPHHHHDVVVSKTPVVLKRSNSSVKVSWTLDLNLTPLENDLKILFGKMAPKVDLFI